MEASEKKISLLNEEEQRINVFHLEEAEQYFVNDMEMPSGRVFQGKNWKRAKAGLEYIEAECNCSWYEMIRRRWEGYEDQEAIFYRGNVITAGTMFEKAEELTREFGMSESNVKMTLLRLRRELREQLKQEGIEV